MSSRKYPRFIISGSATLLGLFLITSQAFATFVQGQSSVQIKNPEFSVKVSVDKEQVQSDPGGELVNYTIDIKNIHNCEVPPLDVVLVFDRSSSMGEDGTTPPQPITTAKTALYEFVDNINTSKDRVGLVSYNQNAVLNASLSNNGQSVKQKVSELTPSGYTNISASIDSARQELAANGRANASKIILLFSDGRANRPEPESSAPQAAINSAAVAKQQGFRIISVAMGRAADIPTMQQIASSGSDYYYAPTADVMKTIYSNIIKAFKGTSPGTLVIDDLTDMLDNMTFHSASKNGKFDGTRVTWNLGDIVCQEKVQLKLTMKVRPGADTEIEKNKVLLTNALNDAFNSNQVSTEIVGPEFAISVTDNRTLAVVGETLTYEITVTNTGAGWGDNVTMINKIPGLVIQDNGSLSDGGQVSGDNQGTWVFDIAPGETKVFTVKGTVVGDVPEGYTQLIDVAQLFNEDVELTAKDNTYVFKTPPASPDFELFACTEKQGDVLTVKLGYENKQNVSQPLDKSTVSVDTITNEPPTLLLPGRYSSVVIADIKPDQSVTWQASVGSFGKEVTANGQTIDCAQLNEAGLPKLPEYQEPDRFLGTNQNVVAAGNSSQPPVVKLEKVTNPSSCELPQVLQVSMLASDKESVITAGQYSVDNGATWHPITNLKGVGTAKATASFQTHKLRDGNYELKVRALNSSNVIGVSAAKVVNIDCEGLIIESPQFNQHNILSPLSGKGTVHAFVKEQQYMAIVILGGPKEAFVTTKLGDVEQRFDLAYNRKLEVWETQLVFTKPGLHELTVTATESNGDKLERSTNSVEVVQFGQTVTPTNEQVSGSNVSLYYRPNSATAWSLWNGAVFGQSNPVEASQYVFFVEPGQYYLEASHPDYFTSTTREFSVTDYSILYSDVVMYHKGDILNWWNSISQTISPAPITDTLTPDLQAMIGHPLPEILLSDGVKSYNNSELVNGKYTVLVTWTDWGTIPAAQLHQFDEYFRNFPTTQEQFNVIPVAMLEGREEDEVLLKRGAYALEILKPAKQDFYNKLFVISAPQYYFLDEQGVVQEILVGARSASDIIWHLQQLSDKELARISSINSD